MATRTSRADRPAPLATNLKAALAERGMTQEALARRINVSLSAMTGWCNGDGLPRWKNLVALADVLGYPPSWFYEDHANSRTAAAAS